MSIVHNNINDVMINNDGRAWFVRKRSRAFPGAQPGFYFEVGQRSGIVEVIFIIRVRSAFSFYILPVCVESEQCVTNLQGKPWIKVFSKELVLSMQWKSKTIL